MKALAGAAGCRPTWPDAVWEKPVGTPDSRHCLAGLLFWAFLWQKYLSNILFTLLINTYCFQSYYNTLGGKKLQQPRLELPENAWGFVDRWRRVPKMWLSKAHVQQSCDLLGQHTDQFAYGAYGEWLLACGILLLHYKMLFCNNIPWYFSTCSPTAA